MPQSLAHIALLVRDYDEAIAWFTGVLGFTLVADEYQPEQDKRWVLDEALRSERLRRPGYSSSRARTIFTGVSSICPRIAPRPAFGSVGAARMRRATSSPSTTLPKAA